LSRPSTILTVSPLKFVDARHPRVEPEGRLRPGMTES
jgi:hypothetical protein